MVRRALGKAWRSILPKTAASLDLGRYAESHYLPVPRDGEGERSAGEPMALTGIAWRLDDQTALLEQLRQAGELFESIRADTRINCERENPGSLIRNGFYHTPDTELYAGMIQHFEPDQIVEIGGGYSTRIARHTIQYLKLTTTLRVIDPEPRADVCEDADEVVRSRIEDYQGELFNSAEKGLLFIDSSHICRKRGDVTYLFCEVLPRLPVGTLIHVHDIYLPYHYPLIYDRWLWNEQYVLAALLCHSQRYKIILSTHYLSRSRPALMRDLAGDAVQPDNDAYCGCGFWIQVV